MKIIGHRGARGLAPENTLAAIEEGIKAGATEVEIDVRVTRDDIPVVNHDRRVNGALIFMHTAAELKANKPDLATLEQAIKKVNRRVPMLLEVKGGEPTEPVLKIIRAFLDKNWKPTDFRFGSKNQKTLRALHKALPNIPIVIIERWSGVRGTWRARQLGTKHILMNRWFIWWYFVSSMSKSGYKLSVYTLNDPKKAAAWQRRGLYGVVTDHPEHFKK
jgi:glycerophosphoryl diester phosphodiesterase